MNILGSATLLLIAGYIGYLCVSPFSLFRLLAVAVTPLNILNAVAKARRHHGIQAVLSLVFAILVLVIKGIASAAGYYDNPPLFARLAFGMLGDSIAIKVGLAGLILLSASIIEAILF